jgi:uncharacterized protein YciI
MPHFLVVGLDGTDAQAPNRRQAARQAHLAKAAADQAAGVLLYAVAQLNEQGHMVGSTMVLNLPSLAAVQAWLTQEPYQQQGVWQQVQVHPAQVPPAFCPPVGTVAL